MTAKHEVLKQNTSRKGGGLRAWVIAIALSLVCGAIAAEIGLRVAFAEFGRLYELVRPSGDARSYELKPGARVLYRGIWDLREEPTLWTVNSDGMRSDREVPPRSDKYRIMTYGDSETFGWAIGLEDTFQRRIEALDPGVEVLNMGIPAYNITNIADYMEKTIDRYQPDRVIYLSHKNDLDRPLVLHPVLSKSWLYRAIRYLEVQIHSKERKAHRRTPEGYAHFRQELGRMVEALRERGIPMTIGVLHWEFEKAYSPAAAYAWTPADGGEPPHFYANVLNFRDIWRGLPRRDHHLAEAAHVEIARRFCRAISGDRDGVCTPPGWVPPSRRQPD